MANEGVSVVLKRLWSKSEKKVSLRAFVRKLAKDGDPMAKNWFDNKKGACNQEKSDKNRARADMERVASKSARKKTKGAPKAAA